MERQSAGRPLPQVPKGRGRGKSGLHRHAVPDNVRRGRPQGKCHRERTAPSSEGVRVKRCGKSAPRCRQRRRHGKPHREQDRIGTATRSVRDIAITPQGDVRPAVRVGCSRHGANLVPEEWPSRTIRKTGALQNPAYRPADALQMRGSAQYAGPLAIFSGGSICAPARCGGCRSSSAAPDIPHTWSIFGSD